MKRTYKKRAPKKKKEIDQEYEGNYDDNFNENFAENINTHTFEEDNSDDEKTQKTKKKNGHLHGSAMNIMNEVIDLIEEFQDSDTEDEKVCTCLPWVEECRPKKLDDVIGHELHIATFKRFIEKKKFHNVLLSGPPGTGKTSTISACAKELYGDDYSLMVMDINASEKRGIDVVRNDIKNFVSTKGIGKIPFKLVILDEADAMTEDAQSMLVSIMRNYTHNARFCLMCNYIKKINPNIQSRCTPFKFSALKNNCIEQKILEIVNKNNFQITQDGIDTLIKISDGDMRKIINYLQATHMAFDIVNSENINKCIGFPLPEEIDNIYGILRTMNIENAYKYTKEIIKKNGYSLMDIVHELFEIYIKKYMNEKNVDIDIQNLILNLRKIEANLTMCQNENIQLSGVVSAFIKARKNIILN